MGIAVVNVLNIDTTGRRRSCIISENSSTAFTRCLRMLRLSHIWYTGVQTLPDRRRMLVQPRYVGRAEQGDIFTFQQRVYISLLICTP